MGGLGGTRVCSCCQGEQMCVVCVVMFVLYVSGVSRGRVYPGWISCTVLYCSVV